MEMKERIKLNAVAKSLGIEHYRQMGESELLEAVAALKGETKVHAPEPETAEVEVEIPVKVTVKAEVVAEEPPKRKVSAPRSSGRKSGRKTGSAPAESPESTAPARKATAVRGEKAKRPSARKSTATKAEVKKADVSALKALKGKRKASAKDTSEKKDGGQRKRDLLKSIGGDKHVPGTANAIGGDNIDWALEWRGGKREPRKSIMSALRKSHGDIHKAHAALAPRWEELIGTNQRTGAKRTEEDALRFLRWLIGRTRWDFVITTEQHIASDAHSKAVKKALASSDKTLGAPKVTGSRKSTKSPKVAPGAKRKPAGPSAAPKRRTRPAANATKGRKAGLAKLAALKA